MSSAAVSRSPLDRRLNGLVTAIQASDCVLVLGPRIAAPAAGPAPGAALADDLARQLIEDLDGPGNAQPELRRAIARYERERSPQACRSFVQEVVREYSGHPTPLHLDLAALPFPLILCATPDTLMFDALRQVGKDNAVAAYYDHHPGLKNNGRLGLPTVDRPIVYSLFGRHDHPETMVLNDLNLLDYLVSVTKENPALPDAVRATLRTPSTVFLFIGFGFENWWLRLLLKVLQVTGVDNRGVSLALEESRAFEGRALEDNKAFFDAAGIFIEPRDWNALAKELRARVVSIPASTLRAVVSTQVSQGRSSAPLVFLSYASEDVQLVEELGNSLEALHLRVWRDKDKLRAGQLWRQQIGRVIGGVDFFIFVQTEAMDRRDDEHKNGIYHRELALALDRRKDMPYGTTFVIHVTVGNCEPRPEPEMREIHRIAIDDEEGVRRLAADLLASFDRDDTA